MLIQQLVQRDGIPPNDILVLFRGDRNEALSSPIKQRLEGIGIPVSDPELVARELEQDANRRSLAILRLMADGEDSLAWATLLNYTRGAGDSFVDWVYEKARPSRTTFGIALLAEYGNVFKGAPRSASKVGPMMDSVLDWLADHTQPGNTPLQGWGHWMVAIPRDDVFPGFSEDLGNIIELVDGVVERDVELGRFLNQIAPLGKDLASSQSRGVRFMSMQASKGLTVKATVVAATEEGVMPRPDCDLSEERRLLYVAMTRAREHLFSDQ